MTKPKPPLSSGFVEGENDHMPMPGMPKTNSGADSGGAAGGAGADVGGLAGGMIGNQVGGEAGKAIGSTAGKLVGQTVASQVFESGSSPLGEAGFDPTTGGIAGPLDGMTSGGLGSPMADGGFAGPLGGGQQEYYPISSANPNSPSGGMGGAGGGGGGGGKRFSANSTWFNFSVNGKSFAVYAFTGTEEVHKPYEFEIELVSKSASEDITSFIGKTGCLTIGDKSGATRPVHGYIRQMEQLHSGNKFTHYRCYLVPRLWFLGQIIDNRIFQQKNVQDIIEQLLKEQGFSGDTFEFKLSKQYEPRDYCVQYGESDLHFISRLCEEEGIYFYFEHTDSSHKLCFCDRENGPNIPGESSLRYFPGSGQVPDSAVIYRLSLRQRVNSNAAQYREWNFKKPKLNQEVKKDETDTEKAPVPQGMKLEQYHYPHLHVEPQKGGEPGTPGQQYTDVQLLRQITFAKWIEGESNIPRMVPSFVFTVREHPRQDLNTDWWVVRTTHFGEQPQVLEHEATSDRGMQYRSTFAAIPRMTRFVPEIEHPKVKIIGDQTALVTGPDGEEIYPDEYGRVKVQFHWDREGKYDENTTCWIRVSQGWAGGQYGTMAIPRIGQEVIVTFLEGNPDRPLITGRVYHELQKVPYKLPDNKTRTVFKSHSSPKAAKEDPRSNGGFNELRIEDKANNEEIYIHAEKDVNIYVRNDWKDIVCANRHATTGADAKFKTSGETHITLKKNRIQHYEKNDDLTIDGNRRTKIKENDELQVDKLLIKATKIMFEATEGISFKVGDNSYIQILPELISIQSSMIEENCDGGKPEALKLDDPVKPAEPAVPDGGSVPNGGEHAKKEPMQREMAKKNEDSFVAAQQAKKAEGTTPLGIPSSKAKVDAFDDISQAQREKLQKEFFQAMQDSYVKTPDGLKMQEQGGWIIKNPDGTYSLDKLPPSHPPTNDPNKLGFAFPRKIPPNAIGTFHTHPSPYEEVWPSEQDLSIAKDMDRPGIVMGINEDTKKVDMQAYDWTFPKK